MKHIITSEEFETLFKSVKSRDDFQSIKQEIQGKLVEYFSKQTYEKDDLKELKDRLYKMIDYAIKRYDDYSTQRHRYLTLGIGVIGSSVALLGIFAANYSILKYPAMFFGAISLTMLFLSGIVVLILYNFSMTPDYPHREIMDIQSWYFKYKFKGSLSPKISKDPSKAALQVKEVAENYINSVENWVEKSKSSNYFIKEDLEQVAILHLLQKYGRDSLENMKRAMNAGVILFSLFFILALILQAFFPVKLAEKCKTQNLMKTSQTTWHLIAMSERPLRESSNLWK